ncbi:CBS domain-containing protein [uncultured Nisaea sp.]|jgi:signal-transduction protein with cAMP-binding, CBS, and nucleotidyltransferase domain|uniref:CBS domain-containing protein n=1 Tax=uncultured Nisaea sp. TaxID=538215 RepID=UPI0030EF5E86|tara:strand:+ start:51 stop:452 length:402 start_codon:yes stop_codon:yes gene_type:complete
MNQHPYVKVEDVMSGNPHVIDGLATVRNAIDLMREHNVSSLVIERRDDRDEYGVVTVGDIAAHVASKDRSPERTSVYEIMSKPVLSVDVGMDIKYAIRMLNRFKLTRALVTRQGDMVGIVTLRDMVVRYTAPD